MGISLQSGFRSAADGPRLIKEQAEGVGSMSRAVTYSFYKENGLLTGKYTIHVDSSTCMQTHK